MFSSVTLHWLFNPKLLGIEEFQWGTLTKTLFIGSHKWVGWLGLSDVKLYKKDRTKLVQCSVVINHFNKNCWESIGNLKPKLVQLSEMVGPDRTWP